MTTQVNANFFASDKEAQLEHWRERGRDLKSAGRTKRQEANQLSWAIGDWLVDGDASLSDRKLWNEAKAITGYPRSTLKNFKMIAKKFPKSRRRDGVSWSHHREVASWQPEAEQDKLLAEYGKRSLRDLRAAMKKRVSDLVVAAGIAARNEAYASVRKEEHPPDAPLPLQFTFNIRNSEGLRFLWSTERQVHRQTSVENMIFWLVKRGIESAGFSKEGVAEFDKAFGNSEFARTNPRFIKKYLKPAVSKQVEG